MTTVVGVPDTRIGELCIIGTGVSVDVSGVAVSITSVGLIAGVDMNSVQDTNIIARKKGIIALLMILIFPCLLC
jgi:hypothetical protein